MQSVGVIGRRMVLQLRKQRVEPVVALVPVLAIASQPYSRRAQWLRFEVAEAGGGAAVARDQTGLFEHLEVTRDGWLRHPKGCGQLRNGRIARGQPREERAASGIGQRTKHSAELIVSVYSHL
jgi:hypothetical protein